LHLRVHDPAYTERLTAFLRSVGLQPRSDALHVFSPYGLSDLLELIVRPNKKKITQSIYEAKVEKWLALWPGLRVIPWMAESGWGENA